MKEYGGDNIFYARSGDDKLYGGDDFFDDLLAGALRCLSHRPLLSGYDEPATLSYQILLIGPMSANVRHLVHHFKFHFLVWRRDSGQ